jgi:hypothetical protein
VAILDEATSALDIDSEKAMYVIEGSLRVEWPCVDYTKAFSKYYSRPCLPYLLLFPNFLRQLSLVNYLWSTRYDALSTWLPDCAYLSVGHRPSLLAFHDHKLVLRTTTSSSSSSPSPRQEGGGKGGLSVVAAELAPPSPSSSFEPIPPGIVKPPGRRRRRRFALFRGSRRR